MFEFKSDIINAFIKARGYTSYLEIGVDRHINFNLIECDLKESVDPREEAEPTYSLTSDDFFKKYKSKTYDFILIDGMHEGNQVYRDICNSLNHLNEGGMVLIHDCCPESEHVASYTMVEGAWTGTSWAGFARYVNETSYLAFTVDIDYGCGIIDTTRESLQYIWNDRREFVSQALSFMKDHLHYLSYEFFNDYTSELINIVSESKFEHMYKDELAL